MTVGVTAPAPGERGLWTAYAVPARAEADGEADRTPSWSHDPLLSTSTSPTRSPKPEGWRSAKTLVDVCETLAKPMPGVRRKSTEHSGLKIAKGMVAQRSAGSALCEAAL